VTNKLYLRLALRRCFSNVCISQFPKSYIHFLPVPEYSKPMVLNLGARLARGRQPLRDLQHGNFLNGKIFRPIYVFKNGGLETKENYVVEEWLEPL